MTGENLERKLEELEARERAVEQRERAAEAKEAKGLRNCLYQHINVSLRTVDAVILVCGLLIVGLTVYGIFH